MAGDVAADIYPYEPLKNSTSIRLLHVERYEASTGAALRYRFVETDLENGALDYICLSYTWDAAVPGQDDHPNSRKMIEIEHAASKAVFHLDVKANLMDFLDQAASSRYITDDVYIWIDALCINQRDLAERAQQVGLMKRVYTQCKGTIVWLGIEFANSLLAVEMIKHLGSIPQSTYDEHSKFIPAQDSARLSQRKKAWAMEKFGSEHWSALVALIERNWFHRVWTIQEFFLPPMISFLCGDEAFSVEGLARSITQLVANIITSLSRMKWSVFCDLRNMIWRRRDNQAVPISALSKWARIRGCSDKRDRVYGLLGLLPSKMDVDYTKELGDVYTVYINTAGSHSFVPYERENCKYRHTPNLPSWVPDFAVPLEPSAWNTQGLNQIYRAGGSVKTDCHASCPQVEGRDMITPLPSSSPRILAVMGTIVDDVNIASGTWDDVLTGQFLVDALTALTTVPYASDGVSILEELGRTLIVDKATALVHGGEISPMSFQLFVKFTLARWLAIPERTEADHQLLQSVLERLRQSGIPTWTEIVALSQRFSGKSYEQQCRDGVGNADENLEMRRYKDTFDRLLTDRRFFVTSGDRMGVGPDSLKGGTVVCVVQNLDFPVLLDQGSEGRYRLLGVCYVRGVMQGEALVGRKFTRIEIE